MENFVLVPYLVWNLYIGTDLQSPSYLNKAQCEQDKARIVELYREAESRFASDAWCRFTVKWRWEKKE